MISFDLPPQIQNMQNMLRLVANNAFRPAARHYDENEHEKPLNLAKLIMGAMARGSEERPSEEGGRPSRPEGEQAQPSIANVSMVLQAEAMSWGDVGLTIFCQPGGGLGGAAIRAAGTPEQRERFLKRFSEGEPKWGAMAMTEPGAGSDTAAISTTAVRGGDEWVLNGEKIFVTSGLMAAQESEGLVVVWATMDKSAGRAGMKAFVVEKGTPGMRVEKVEKKLGIRASDTATIILDNCHIPLDHCLGSPEVDRRETEGFRGAMATFDATRPAVAAMALGVGRAALEYVKEALEKEGVQIRYGAPRHKLTAIERDIMDMEANLKAAWLLVIRSAWMMDQRERNNLEASMGKAKAGLAVTRITQKAVEFMGPLGYSRKHLLEKWMRDSKITDIFEGTGQINMLIVARRILGYSSSELK